MVGVPDIKRKRTFTGTRKSQSNLCIRDADQPDASSSAFARSRSPIASSRGGRRSRRRSPTPHARHLDRRDGHQQAHSFLPPSDMEMIGHTGGGGSDSDGRAMQTPRAPRRPPSEGRSASAHNRRMAAGNPSSMDADGDDDQRSTRTGGGEDETPQAARRGARLTAVELIKEKADLRDTILKAVDRLSGSKSQSKKLADAISRIAPGQLSSDDVKDSKEAIEQSRKQQEELCKLKNTLDTARRQEIDEFKDNLAVQLGRADECRERCKEMLDAVVYVQNLGKQEKRKDQSRLRYRRNLVTNGLVAGGFGDRYSKQVVIFLKDGSRPYHNVDDAGSHNEVLIWTSENKRAKQLRDLMFELTPQEMMDGHRKDLDDALEQNSKWGGALGKMHCNMGRATEFLATARAEHLDRSACPWMCAVRRYRFRFGPGAFPLPGFGGYCSNIGEIPMHLLVMPVDSVLAKGISLPDLPAFLETPSGGQCFSEQAKLVHLPPAGWAWIPYGWVPIPLSLGGSEPTEIVEANSSDTKAKKKESDMSDNGYLWHLTVWSQHLRSAMSENVWAAVRAWNEEYLNKKRHLRAWTSRAELFDRFVNEATS